MTKTGMNQILNTIKKMQNNTNELKTVRSNILRSITQSNNKYKIWEVLNSPGGEQILNRHGLKLVIVYPVVIHNNYNSLLNANRRKNFLQVITKKEGQFVLAIRPA